MVRCSVIVPAFNKAALTHQCLSALLKARASVANQVIVVDDASTDTTTQMLSEFGNQLNVISHTQNAGFAVSCNEGAASSASEYLVFLNNDTVPSAGWLDALVRYADANPEAAVVGSRLLFPNNTVQHAGVVICEDRIPRHLYSGFPGEHPAVLKSRRFQIVTAACALVRRDVFEAVGGFDTAYRNGFEDVDLCLRLREIGHEVHYCAESVLYHLESVSRNLQSSDEVNNLHRYLERWGHRVVPDDFRYYLEDGLISPSYPGGYPVRLEVSPLLALGNGSPHGRLADELLALRAGQVAELLRENIALTVQVLEARNGGGSRTLLGGRPEPPHSSSPAQRDLEKHARLVREGAIHWVSELPSGQTISVLIPVKNGAPHLRELLPRILSQDTRHNIELVAVDSASSDESVGVLREYDATIVTIPAELFNHGLTRNLLARFARGDFLVFVNQDVLPCDRKWLGNLVGPLSEDETVAGVCSRVLPREDADVLTRRDALMDPNGASVSSSREMADSAKRAAFDHHRLRLLINFHTISAALRPSVFAKVPFREMVRIGEDLMWAKEVLEAGYKIRHEASSAVFHSHSYSYLELLQRNFDDGVANREIVGRTLSTHELEPLLSSLVRDDWRYLEIECGMAGSDLEHWQLVAALRRASQVTGQWLGVNQELLQGEALDHLSLTGRIKASSSEPFVKVEG